MWKEGQSQKMWFISLTYLKTEVKKKMWKEEDRVNPIWNAADRLPFNLKTKGSPVLFSINENVVGFQMAMRGDCLISADPNALMCNQ